MHRQWWCCRDRGCGPWYSQVLPCPCLVLWWSCLVFWLSCLVMVLSSSLLFFIVLVLTCLLILPWSCLVLSCLVLSCLALPWLGLAWLGLAWLVLSWLVLSCPVIVLSCPVMVLRLSCLVLWLSRLVLSCLLLSYLVFSCLWFCRSLWPSDRSCAERSKSWTPARQSLIPIVPSDPVSNEKVRLIRFFRSLFLMTRQRRRQRQQI